MKTLGIHTKYFRFESREKATEAAEPLTSHKVDIDQECLVIFISVEKEDVASPISVAAQLVSDILNRSEQLNVKMVVVYPYVHLTENPSTPRIALKVLNEIESRLAKSLEVVRAPFGWYKAFDIACIGHPLSEWSGRYKPGQGVEASGKKKPERKPSEFTRFVIVDLEGNTFDVAPANFAECPIFSHAQPVYDMLKQFVSNELTQGVVTEGPPKHISYMRRHELVDYCEASEKVITNGIPKGY